MSNEAEENNQPSQAKEARSPADLAVYEFDYMVYDLYTGVEREIRESLYNMAEELGQERLKGPLFAMTHELAQNGLKALYKRIYYKYFIEEVGLSDVPYEEWLKLFKTEIEAHQAENFARLCRSKNLYVEVSGKIIGDVFKILIANDGAPSEVELQRLHRIIERAKQKNGSAFIFEEDDGTDEQKEGGGLGLTLIIMSLRGLGVSPDNFTIETREDRTYASLELPLSLLVPSMSVNSAEKKKLT